MQEDRIVELFGKSFIVNVDAGNVWIRKDLKRLKDGKEMGANYFNKAICKQEPIYCFICVELLMMVKTLEDLHRDL